MTPGAAEPFRFQRVAAYVLCVRDGAVLLTRYSDLAPEPGRWALPGGGVHHGEHPRDAAARETAEETGLRVEVGDVLDVTSVHFTGVAPSGRLEDFHSVGLVFRATCPDVRPPRVQEEAGTTDDAAWVPVEGVRAGRVPLSRAVVTALPWLMTGPLAGEAPPVAAP
ncbi:MAG: NUDIX hydrolase [Actinomycetes bacterium]